MIKAAASFVGMGVIDSDPYIPGGSGSQWVRVYILNTSLFAIPLTRKF